MIPAARRFKAALVRWGEALVIAGQSHLGMIRSISVESARAYLSDSDIVSYGRPIYLATVAADEAVTSGATVAWDGRSLTLRSVVALRVRGVVVAQEWILS